MFDGDHRLGTMGHTSPVFPPVDQIYVPFSRPPTLLLYLLVLDL